MTATAPRTCPLCGATLPEHRYLACDPSNWRIELREAQAYLKFLQQIAADPTFPVEVRSRVRHDLLGQQQLVDQLKATLAHAD